MTIRCEKNIHVIFNLFLKKLLNKNEKKNYNLQIVLFSRLSQMIIENKNYNNYIKFKRQCKFCFEYYKT